ncbi:MAG: hypothetical protein ACLUD0_05465 [Eubacterium ramulus]
MSDGAAFAILMSREKAEQLGIKPIAKFVGRLQWWGMRDGRYMGLGPIYASPQRQ